MSRHDDAVSLRHIIVYSREAIDILGGRSSSGIEDDRTTQLALVKLVGIVGKAAWRVSKETRERFPDISWRETVATCNRLAHGYDSVDLDILTEIVRNRLPEIAHRLDAEDGRLTSQGAMANRDTSVSVFSRELGIKPVTLCRYVGPRGELREQGKRSLPPEPLR